jgi:hypothetical protein
MGNFDFVGFAAVKAEDHVDAAIAQSSDTGSASRRRYGPTAGNNGDGA